MENGNNSLRDGKLIQSRSIEMATLRAQHLLKRNVDALLAARGQTRKELAHWCRRSESWISQIFTSPDRNLPLKYLDRIADFFGLATYQLFAPGISPLTERRSGKDRRTGVERRVSRAAEMLEAAPSFSELESQLRRLGADEYRRFVRRAFGALALVDLERSGGGPLDHEDPTAPTRTRGGSSPPKRKR
jgi:hypothetical protein